MGERDRDLPVELLRDVSRSFYLTLRVLPRRVRSQIGIAYLLARATDTIADTTIVPLDQRLAALDQLRCHIAGRSVDAPDLTRFSAGLDQSEVASSRLSPPVVASPAERFLLRRIGDVFSAMRRFSEADQQRIQTVLDTITSGQVLDLQRFAKLPQGKVHALDSDAELDDYLYRVAGCVGEFWTRICRAHLFPGAAVNDAFLLETGVRYGKGLQLTNILRDLRRDLRSGRCYLPVSQLSAQGLDPADLLEPASEQKFRPVFDHYCRAAIDHLRAGWDYTNHLPNSCVRVRLACAWPILIGKRTLELVSRSPIAGEPAKVSRKTVQWILARSVLAYPWPRLWKAQWRES
jgi:farnesyl-diphosphate farnesyltransferase